MKNPYNHVLTLLIFTPLFLLIISGAYAAPTTTTILTIAGEADAAQVPGSYLISGYLTTETGYPLVRKEVVLLTSETHEFTEQSPASTAVQTDDTGQYQFHGVMPVSGPYFRVQFPGDPVCKRSESAIVFADNHTILQTAEEITTAGGVGTLIIQSNPRDGLIFVDGEMKGETPEIVGNLAAGEHAVVIAKDGYLNETMDAFVIAGRTSTISTSLTDERMGTAQGSIWPDSSMMTSDNRTPVYSYDQGPFSLRVYDNATAENETSEPPQVTTLYSENTDGTGFSLSIIMKDKPKPNLTGT